MKISEIRSFCADRYLLIRVYTDKGLVGNGEAGLWAHHGIVKAAIDELAEYFIGKDPLHIQHHHQLVSRHTHFTGAVLGAALSAIDIALWDILGKSVSMPVYQLLGGKTRNKIKVFENISGNTENHIAADAKKHVESGYTSLRMTPFFDGFEGKCASQVIDDAVSMVECVRTAIGYRVDLGVEIHRNLRIEEAIILARELEPYRILYYEDPLAPESIEALKNVAKNVRLPIATGERFHSLQQFKELVDAGLVSLIRPDISLAGGFTQAKKIASVAEAAFVGVFPHLMGSPVNNSAFAHFAAGIPNYTHMEANLLPSYLDEIIDEQMPIEGGYRILTDRPGIGIEIKEEVLDRFPQRKVKISGHFHADGSVAH